MIQVLITKQELERFTVTDKEVFELYNEVKQKLPNLYLQERNIPEHKKFLQKDVPAHNLYSIYIDHDTQVQQVNFCQDHAWSINTSVRKSYIITYFYGLLNGLSHK